MSCPRDRRLHIVGIGYLNRYKNQGHGKTISLIGAECVHGIVHGDRVRAGEEKQDTRRCASSGPEAAYTGRVKDRRRAAPVFQGK